MLDVFRKQFFMIFLYTLVILWFSRTARHILFWLYLWQLKEYHIGRFLDHFRTAKGKQIFLNPLFGAKVFLFFWFFISREFFLRILFFLYLFETGKAAWDFFKKTFLKPVFTPKILILTGAGLLTESALLVFIFLNTLGYFGLGLLGLDIFGPFIISAIVLLLQPFAVLGRARIIQKAKQKRSAIKNLLVIGVTGSYGKTSTKEFLAAILSEKFKVCKTKAHQNSEVGVSQCILQDLKPEHEILIVEMGAYGKGGIKLLCDITKPNIGIVTGVNEQHLALFGSMENILSAEGGGELMESLQKDGIVILNWDNDKIKNQKLNIKNTNQKLKIIKYSTKSQEDLWAEDITVEKEYVSFRGVARDNDVAQFKVNVLGAHYVSNLLAAAACAKELGMTMIEIAEQCKKITSNMAGMTLKKGVSGVNIIDATYSANPDGVIAHLEYLKVWEGRKAIIMPCLIELGKASREVHRRIGKKIGEVCDLAIITTKERFNDIKLGAMETGMEEESILFLENPKEIFEKINKFAIEESTLLLEGRISRQTTNLLAVST